MSFARSRPVPAPRCLSAGVPLALALVLTLLATPGATAGDVFIDADGDGFSVADGDCCDSFADGCTLPAAVNPAAMEFVGNGLDDDCDAEIDESDPVCGEDSVLDDPDAIEGAAVLGICRQAQGAQDWGLVSAAYTRANGTPSNLLGLSRGLLPDFGANVAPFAGGRMLALSSGHARPLNQPGACGGRSCTVLGAGTAPVGFPQNVPGCPGPNASIFDDPALQLSLRAPSNAVGFRLRYRFYAHDWPEFVCNAFNDQMLILMTPAPDGSLNGNLAFDGATRPTGVNHAGITICDPNDSGAFGGPVLPDPYCPDGTADLVGTGFDLSAGAMKWQLVEAAVEPLQTIQLRMTVFDVGDATFDSTALFDGFEWVLEPALLLSVFEDGFEGD